MSSAQISRDDEGRLAAVRLYDDIETPVRDA